MGNSQRAVHLSVKNKKALSSPNDKAKTPHKYNLFIAMLQSSKKIYNIIFALYYRL